MRIINRIACAVFASWLALASPVWAAIAATTVWEIRSTGSDSNGGGFNSARGGTDYSQQDAAQASGTVSVSGTTCTATAGIFTSVMVGNLITDGTSWREITAFTSSTVVTLDSTVAWTAASVKVGGALASPGMVSGLILSGNRVYIGSGTYLISSTANVSGGRLAPGASGGAVIEFIGYQTARDDDGTPPVLKANTTAITIIAPAGAGYVWRNLDLDCNSQSGVAGFSPGSNQNQYLRRIICRNGLAGTVGLFIRPNSYLVQCRAINYAGTGINSQGLLVNCDADGTGTTSAIGIQCSTSSVVVGCVSRNYTGSGARGAQDQGGPVIVLNSVFYNNTTGLHVQPNTNASRTLVMNSVFYNNTTGISSGGTATSGLALNNAYKNTADLDFTATSAWNESGKVSLSVDPFTAASSGDFSLNNTSGGGASCRGAGLSFVLPGISTPAYPDIGIVQHRGGTTAVGF